MKKTWVIVMGFCLFLIGCDSLRFAPSERQKQNAWLHNRTTALAADSAEAENASNKLQGLTRLGELQSRAFSTYYGLPKEFPPAETAEQILSESNFNLAQAALQESPERPGGWELADAALEVAIGICALFSGVYGTRIARFLKKTKDKSQALREIIEGNELFKKQHQEQNMAFKQAHKDQSPQTRKIVAEMKT